MGWDEDKHAVKTPIAVERQGGEKVDMVVHTCYLSTRDWGRRVMSLSPAYNMFKASLKY